MKKSDTNQDKKLEMNLSKLPLNGNLGLLAYGDIAFEAWRDLKRANLKKSNNEKK